MSPLMKDARVSPPVEAAETPTEYVLTAELPGISMENVEIHVADARTFRFPLEIAEEKVSAEFANGVLTVRVPKLQQQKVPPRTVPIAKK